MKKTALKQKSSSDVAKAKDRIQAKIRAIAIRRDGGCVFREYPESGQCGGYRNDGELILQFDHLNTRARNISYGDPRLGICVCLRHHFYYKKQYPTEYERIVREAIGEYRAALLDRVREDRRSYHFTHSDWLKLEIALDQELNHEKS